MRHTLGNFRTTIRLLNDDITACKVLSGQELTRQRRRSTLTLRSQSHTDSVRKDVDTLENACSALVRKLDLLVRPADQRGFACFRGSTTERPR